MTSGFPLALDSLLTRERPSPAEAVAIVLELCRQIRPADGAAVVTPPVTRASVLLDAEGGVATRGGTVTEDDQTVSLLGHLLLELVDDRPDTSRLRRVAARAARSLPGDSRGVSVRRLTSALRRNAPSNPRRAVAAFVQRACGGERGAATDEPGRMVFVARGAARLLSPLWRRIA